MFFTTLQWYNSTNTHSQTLLVWWFSLCCWKFWVSPNKKSITTKTMEKGESEQREAGIPNVMPQISFSQELCLHKTNDTSSIFFHCRYSRRHYYSIESNERLQLTTHKLHFNLPSSVHETKQDGQSCRIRNSAKQTPAQSWALPHWRSLSILRLSQGEFVVASWAWLQVRLSVIAIHKQISSCSDHATESIIHSFH